MSKYLPVNVVRSVKVRPVLFLEVIEGDGTESCPLNRITYYYDAESGEKIGQDYYWDGEAFSSVAELLKELKREAKT